MQDHFTAAITYYHKVSYYWLDFSFITLSYSAYVPCKSDLSCIKKQVEDFWWNNVCCITSWWCSNIRISFVIIASWCCMIGRPYTRYFWRVTSTSALGLCFVFSFSLCWFSVLGFLSQKENWPILIYWFVYLRCKCYSFICCNEKKIWKLCESLCRAFCVNFKASIFLIYYLLGTLR